MNKYMIPKIEELETVKQAFVELEATETLIDSLSEHKKDSIAASDLLAYARGDGEKAQQIKTALIRFPAMRKTLKGFLFQVSCYYIPEAIAASTEEFPERSIEGCRLKIETSRAETNQYYLIIELGENGEIPSSLILCDLEDRFEQIQLPPPRRGTIQVTVTIESGIPDMLSDPKTAIYLR